MRFSIAAILGLAAIATAQSSAVNATSSISRVASSTVASLSPQQTCLAACGGADICCQARCVNVPCPSALQANATTECAARCPQGNGTLAETDRYAACQASCVSSYFFSTGAAAATASGSRAASSGAATTTGTNTASRTGSATGSSTASATQNAAPGVRFGAAGAGLIGLIIAGLAM